MTPARRPAPRQPAPLSLAALSSPADTYAAALSLLGAGYVDEAHAVLTSGADAGFPACRAAADQIERNPPRGDAARRLIAAALDAAREDA
jgi:hypothetical protein